MPDLTLDSTLTPAVHLSRNLSLAGYRGAIPGPRKIYDLVLRGALPSEMVNGRWFYRSDKLPEIAALLSLTAPPNQAPRTRRAPAEQQKTAA